MTFRPQMSAAAPRYTMRCEASLPVQPACCPLTHVNILHQMFSLAAKVALPAPSCWLLNMLVARAQWPPDAPCSTV